MSEIAIIAPYESLVSMARDISAARKPTISVTYGLMADAVDIARRLKREGAQVIISRGGTALIVQHASALSLPVVEIPITAYDVVRAVSRAKDYGNRISIIGFENMVLGAKTLEDAFGVTINEVVLKHAMEVDAKARQAKHDGVDVLIGGVVTVKAAERHGIPAVLIESGPEAIRQAVDEAQRVLWVKKRENARAEQLKSILDNVSDGIVAVDETGHISVFNPAAERLIGLSAARAVGQHIRSVLPQVRLGKVLAGESLEITEVHTINNAQVSVLAVPILVNGTCIGAIAALQEIARLQSLERHVRGKLYARGHVARFSFSDVVGESEAMRSAIEKARRYGSVDSTLLILGETGTGKEIFAQSIHSVSLRKSGPFVAVNCAALPEDLLESELFGYVAGAFTGARKEGKAGLFELAHRGTIFLDEIAGMTEKLQARLLRVLAEREVMRLGDDRVIPVDVRVIAASNRDLERLVAEGRFRQDLYYRLDVLKLLLPPLRERVRDIPLLTDKFLDLAAEKTGIARPEITGEAMDILISHPWPGNVRELKNTLERIVVLSSGEPIGPLLVAEALGATDRARTSSAPRPLREMMNSISKEVVEHALELAGGNRTEAAKSLGIDRSTLWRRLKHR